MVTGMDMTLVLILAAIWTGITLIAGPTAVALYHRASYRREANELLRSDLPPTRPSQHRPAKQAFIEVARPPRGLMDAVRILRIPA